MFYLTFLLSFYTNTKHSNIATNNSTITVKLQGRTYLPTYLNAKYIYLKTANKPLPGHDPYAVPLCTQNKF